MIKKISLLTFLFIILTLTFVSPQKAHAGFFDFFDLRKNIEEIVTGRSDGEPVEEIKGLSIWQRISEFFQKFSFKSTPKPSPAPTPVPKPFIKTTTTST